MKVRAIDSDGDWTFGNGRGNYLRDKKALAQMLATRLASFLGDCFFALGEGLDWFTLLGGKDRLAIELGVRTMVLNTSGVTGLVSLSIISDPKTRGLSIEYAVNTVYGPVANQFTLDQNGIG